jgi:hypothetical protein
LAVGEQYDLGALVAAACVATGGWSMLISRTVTERFETADGTVLGATVLAVCLAYALGPRVRKVWSDESTRRLVTLRR